MYGNIRTFEELQDFIWEEKQSCCECLLDRLSELDDFQRGRRKGEIDGYDNVLQVLRSILKHGEDLNEMERRDEVSLQSPYEAE